MVRAESKEKASVWLGFRGLSGCNLLLSGRGRSRGGTSGCNTDVRGCGACCHGRVEAVVEGAGARGIGATGLDLVGLVCMPLI